MRLEKAIRVGPLCFYCEEELQRRSVSRSRFTIRLRYLTSLGRAAEVTLAPFYILVIRAAMIYRHI